MATPVALVAAGVGQAAPTLTIAEAQSQIAALEGQEDGAVEAYDAGQIAATTATARASAAQVQVTTQSAKLTTMLAGIRSFAVASYVTGGINPLSAILAGGNPEEVLQRAGALDQIAHGHQIKVDAIEAQAVVLADAQKTAQQRASDASTALSRLATSRDHIQTLIAQQQAVLSHLQAAARAELLAQQRAAEAAAAAAARAAIAAQQRAMAQAAAAQRAQAARQAAARTAATKRTASRGIGSSGSSGSSGSTGSGGGSTGSGGGSTGTGSGPTDPPTHPISGGDAGLIALTAAESVLGAPYQWGAAGPDSFDCSGLVLWAFAKAGVSLPHSAAAQYGYGTHVSLSALQPGDLIFYDDGSSIGHVGIYFGNGEMIDANHTGGWVGLRPLYANPVGATRI